MKISWKKRFKTLSYTYAAVVVGLISSLFLYSLDLFSLNFWLVTILAFIIVTVFDLFVLSVVDEPNMTPAKFLFRVMVSAVGIQFAFACIYFFAANTMAHLVRSGMPITSFGDCMYFSGATLFTVGYGDIVPIGDFRFTAIAEVYGGTLFIFSFFAWGLSTIASRGSSKKS